MRFAWNETHIARLRQMAADGATATEVALEFGGGCSRSAVLGKAQRNGVRFGMNRVPGEKKPRRARVSTGNQKNSVWSTLSVDRLRELVAQGYGPNAAAQTLSREFGAVITANAARNKAARLRLPKVARARQQDVVAPVIAPEPEPVLAVVGVTLMDLTHTMCRWPIGDPRRPEFRFCGAGKMGERPYCAAHVRLAYEPRRSVQRAPQQASAVDEASARRRREILTARLMQF